MDCTRRGARKNAAHRRSPTISLPGLYDFFAQTIRTQQRSEPMPLAVISIACPSRMISRASSGC
jgi:hypothetical protein